jgi:uncharacterized protein YjbI with pentapeptide repeats/lipoprotein-anchoring transpeptidase ErfK/SrfK
LSPTPNHAEILRRGPKAWNAWRKKNPSTVPDLAGIALKSSERQLGPINGRPINLKAAWLQAAVLRFATLSAADLEAADMSGADLMHARLDEANLSAANLINARLDHADLAGANLTKVNLRGASLRFATLSTADLETADMSGADLMYARLDRANLSATNLTNARLDYADFAGTNLTKVNLRGASLRNASNLTQSQLEESIGSHSTILPPHLQGSVSWSAARSQIEPTAFERRDLRPRAPHTAHVNVSYISSNNRTAWLVGVLLIGGALATTGFVWQHMSLDTSRAQRGPEQSRAEPKPSLDPRDQGSQLSAGHALMEQKVAELSASAVRTVDRIEVVLFVQRSAPETLTEQKTVAELQPSAYAEITHPAAREERTEIAELHPAQEKVRQIAPHEAGAVVELRTSDEPKQSRQVLGPSEHDPRMAKVNRSNGTFEASSLGSLVSPAFTRQATIPSASNEAVLSNPLIPPIITAPAETATVYALKQSAASLSNETLRPRVVAFLPSSAIRRDVLTALPPGVKVSLTSVREQVRPFFAKVQNATDLADGEPMTLSISLSQQKINVYRGTTLVTTSNVSSGMPGFATKPGVFSILEKQKFHHSNIFSGAPMPWMQRLTRSGTALHGGVVPGYPASHGCVRIPFSFAPKLFQMTTVGGNVIIANDELTPKLIEHPNLFQLLPPPPAMARREQIPQLRSSDASEVGAEGASSSVILAKLSSTTIDVLSTSELVASDNPEHPPTANRASPSVNDGGGVMAPVPLRILVTRQTQRDQMIGVQNILSSMGYLKPQNFDGTFGKTTVAAIRAFQKANGLPEKGDFSDDLVKKLYEVIGKSVPPEGHLFVRQGFSRLFDVPVALRQPNQPLGTHVYTALNLAPGDTKTHWMAMSLEGNPASALDRIEIPTDARRKISERLTPGSSLIVADTSVDSAILPEGDDFLVWANNPSAESEPPKPKQANLTPAKPKQANLTRARAKQANLTRARAKRATSSHARAAPVPNETNYSRRPRFGGFGLFSRW